MREAGQTTRRDHSVSRIGGPDRYESRVSLAGSTAPPETAGAGRPLGSHEVFVGDGRPAVGLEMLGLVLLAANIWWIYAVGALTGGTPDPPVQLFLVCAAAYVLARLVGRLREWLVPAALVCVAAVVALATPDVLSSWALSGPFGYTNAKGAFFAQGAIAALFLVLTCKGPLPRALGTVAAAGFAVVPFVVSSLAAAALLVAVFPIVLAGSTRRAARTAVAALGGLFVLGLAATLVLGAGYSRQGREGPLEGTAREALTERRLLLWHEALTLLRQHPITGVGPGRFKHSSPTARAFPGARWAHNEFLQHGAETGIVGLALLALSFLWGFARLWAAADARPAVLGAAALAVLGVHASVDYVMHFPLVPVFAAALVGAGTRSRSESIQRDHPRLRAT